MEDISLRRAEIGDQKALTALVSRCGGPSLMRKLFGSFTFPQLIETGYLAIIACPVTSNTETDSNEEEAVGFAVFSDAPRECSDADGWLEWLKDSHTVEDVEIGNTLWVEFLLLDQIHGDQVLQQLLLTTFTTIPEVDQILMQIPAGEKTTSSMASAFYEVKQQLDAAFVDNPLAKLYSEYRLLICEREAFMPTLAIRQACVEDHDDLVPVFESQSQALSQSFGEFFLADMIEAQDDENRALVALANERAVGLMGVSTELDIEMLQQCFNLEPFGNLARSEDREATVREVTEKQEAMTRSQRIVVLGPVGCGFEKVAEAIAKELGIQIVDANSAVTSDQGRKIVDAGEPLDLALFKQDVLAAIASIEEGFVLCGFPQTSEQAKLLYETGINLDAVVLVQISEEILIQRATGAKQDPLTKKIYYGEEDDDDPENESIAERVTEFQVDTEENVSENYRTYRTLLYDIVSFYGTLDLPEDFDKQDDSQDPEILREDPETADLLDLVEESRLGSGGIIEVVYGNQKLSTMCKNAIEAILDMVEEKNKEIYSKQEEESLGTYAAADGNTFAVTLFCLDHMYECRALDFLPHLFETFPEREFCILTVPPTNPESILLKYFTPVEPRPGSTFSHALYVLHRDAVAALGRVSVARYSRSSHHSQLKRLLLGNRNASAILEAAEVCREFEDIPLSENPREVVFVAMVGRQVIGVVCSNRNSTSTDDVAWLKANYHIESFVVFERHRARNQAVLSHAAINPLFSLHTRFILKEAMRLYDKTVMYHEGLPGEAPSRPILFHFVPVRPRRRMEQQPFQTLPLFYRNDDTSTQGGPVNSLHFLSRRLLTEPKLTVNWRLVIIGGSSCALSLIESLIFTPYLNFTNITLVSPSGIGLEYIEPDGPAFLPVDMDSPNKTRLLSMGLAAHIRIIRSAMVDMDIESKAIMLPDSKIVPYDVLVLTTGLQDGTAKKLGFKRGEIPENLVNLSDARSQKRLEKKIPMLAPSDKVVVYGTGVACLTAIAGMLEFGVQGNTITLIRPGWNASDMSNKLSLGSSSVDEAVDATLLDAGVTLISDLTISKAFLTSGQISVVEFIEVDTGNCVSMDCDLLLTNDTPQVDPDVFKAINDSGLVFDGRLVVDLRLRTVNDSVYGGGTLTKYSRLHRGAIHHSFYSSQDIGAYLGACVLQKIDPLSSQDNEPETRPEFTCPRAISAIIPGGYRYVRISLPEVDPECRKMPTGSVGQTPFTLVKLGVQGKIQELIYYGQEPVEVGNLMCIVGLQESYVNSAESSFDKHLVSDWITFLRSDWASAIYHDRFPQFVSTLRRQLLQEMGTQDLVDMVLNGFEEGKDETILANLRKMGVGVYGTKLLPSTKRFVETRALDFLRKNRNTLPRFLLAETAAGGGK